MTDAYEIRSGCGGRRPFGVLQARIAEGRGAALADALAEVEKP